jgi:hypothetical protein
VKYHGKVKVSPKSFDKRKDKYFFEKLARNPNAEEIMISNFCKNPSVWIKDLTTDEAFSIMLKWKKKIENFTYLFLEDCNNLKENFNENFSCQENSYPYILQLYLKEKIEIETLIALIDVSDSIDYLNKKLHDDPLWTETVHLMDKIYPFLKYDRDKIKKALLKKFSI